MLISANLMIMINLYPLGVDGLERILIIFCKGSMLSFKY